MRYRRRWGYALESYPLIPLVKSSSPQERKKRYALFLEVKENAMMTKRRRRGEQEDRGYLLGETLFARRPTLHVAYLRKSDGHTWEATETPRVSRERTGKKARESPRAETAKLNSCATGVAVELLGRTNDVRAFSCERSASVVKRPRGKGTLSLLLAIDVPKSFVLFICTRTD